MKSVPSPSILLPLLITAAAYTLTGWVSLWLAVPPAYASPLYPPAGIALASVLTYGLRVLPGVALGALTVNVLIATARDQPMFTSAAATALPVAIAIGASAQAALGAWLVRRFVGKPLTLGEPRDVLRFFLLGALLACTVNATVATLALWQAGALPVGNAAITWWIWWAGDTLGVLIAAPVALTLIGRPRGEWVHRRFSVGLSLVLVTALLATAGAYVARWDQQRTRVIFERDATRSADALAEQLSNPVQALQAVHGTAAVIGGLPPKALREVSRYWLAQPFHLQAIGWAQHVQRSEIPRLEAEVSAELDRPGYHVFDRTDAQSASDAQSDPDVVAIRAIEPPGDNERALGVNPLSIAPARPAMAATLATGQPAASAGFRLTQETGTQTGVVLYQALHRGAAARENAVGVAFVTLRMEEAVGSVAARLPPYLRWCLVDLDAKPAPARLAGPPGCEHETLPASAFVHERAIDYAGRHWQLRLSAPVAAVPDARQWNAWLFSLVGLMAASMLGALLLTVTGRARRIETAVARRTADLQREVTERTRTEAALRESEQRFRSMFDQVPIGLVYADLNGRIQQANPKLREMVAYPDLAGISVISLTHPEDRAADVELSRRMIAGEIPGYRYQKRLIARDGRVVRVQTGVSLLRDPIGRPERIVGVVEDITEHLKLQEAERARESAEAANRAKSEFVSRMSHELRTPLNAMLGFAQLLELDQQRPLPPHQVEWTSQIQQAGWHLLHMINDTLDLSRIESGSLKLDLAPVALAEVVDATRALVEQAAQRRNVAIHQHLDASARAVLGDETRVKQILTNLLSNAVKYNVEGGQVRVMSRLAGADTVEVEVLDTGLGLTPAQMAELFQPFNRLGREAYGEGTGIGLVISRRLAELMGGTLTAHSVPGHGSSFVLRLPLAVAPEQTATAPAAVDRLPPHYRQRLVHYIEDNETNAEVMRGIVSQRPQIALSVSANGLDGLQSIRQSRPSLVLLDMHLPDIDGLELLRHLKQDPLTAAIPVVVVSADATGGRIDEALALGAAHYVTKPVNVADMLTLLDEVLEDQDTRFSVDL